MIFIIIYPKKKKEKKSTCKIVELVTFLFLLCIKLIFFFMFSQVALEVEKVHNVKKLLKLLDLSIWVQEIC